MLAPTTTPTAGGRSDPAPDPRTARYEANAYHISQGQQLYDRFNCTGCHAHGGGDIGPALMDQEWIYGGKAEQIVATLIQGRPNGMPSFRNMLTEQQMWQIAAYVRSMSGNVPKDAVSSRGDTMANTEPLTLTERKPVVGASSIDPERARSDGCSASRRWRCLAARGCNRQRTLRGAMRRSPAGCSSCSCG